MENGLKKLLSALKIVSPDFFVRMHGCVSVWVLWLCGYVCMSKVTGYEHFLKAFKSLFPHYPNTR